MLKNLNKNKNKRKGSVCNETIEKINGRELTELHRYLGTGAPRSWVAPRLLFGMLGLCFAAIGWYRRKPSCFETSRLLLSVIKSRATSTSGSRVWVVVIVVTRCK